MNKKLILDSENNSPKGGGIGRPKKNRELLVGRAGRNAIEREDVARESLRWQRRKETIERLGGS